MIKHLCWLVTVLLFITSLNLAQTKSDSVIARAAFIKIQTTQADSLNHVALQLATPSASTADLDKAIGNIMTGLHIYSKFNDSVGLCQTFDHLALVYHLQKKYIQAKWFFIQSNTLSRQRNDTLNIIASLINLASVKDDIKDFAMAKIDLDEALLLAKTQRTINQQIEVQKALAQYYSKKGDAPAAAIALNRISYLRDSIAKPITQQKWQPQANALSKEDTMHNNTVITVITLITAILAGICMLFYLRKRKRKQ